MDVTIAKRNIISSVGDIKVVQFCLFCTTTEAITTKDQAIIKNVKLVRKQSKWK